MVTGADESALCNKKMAVTRFREEVTMELLHVPETNASITVTDNAFSSVNRAVVNCGSDLLARGRIHYE